MILREDCMLEGEIVVIETRVWKRQRETIYSGEKIRGKTIFTEG